MVTPLTESQQADLRSFIMNKFMKEDVAIEYRHDPDIIGGFILNAGDIEYDKSYRTSLRLMKESLHSKAAEYTENAGEDKIVSGSMSDIISVLKTEVKDFDVKTGATETRIYYTSRRRNCKSSGHEFGNVRRACRV